MGAGERDLHVLHYKEFKVKRDHTHGFFYAVSESAGDLTDKFPSVAAACKAIEQFYNNVGRSRSATPAYAKPDHRRRLGFFDGRVTSG